MVDLEKVLDSFGETVIAGVAIPLLVGLLTATGRTSPTTNLAIPVFAGVGAFFKFIQKILASPPFEWEVAKDIGFGGLVGFFILSFIPFAISAFAVLGVPFNKFPTLILPYTYGFAVFSVAAYTYYKVTRHEAIRELPFSVRGPLLLLAVVATPYLAVVITQELVQIVAGKW